MLGAMPSQAQQAGGRPAPSMPAQVRRVDAKEAHRAFLDGGRAIEADDLALAEQKFREAVDLDPNQAEYGTALILTREREVASLVQRASQARLTGHAADAEALLAQARSIAPNSAVLAQHEPGGAAGEPVVPSSQTPWVGQDPTLAGPIDLRPDPTRRSFHLRSDGHSALQQVAAAFGIRAVLDESVPDQPLRFELEDTSYAQAMGILLKMTGSFAVPLDGRSVLIARDTPDNRDRFEKLLEETIYIPGSSPEQMAEIGNLIRSVFEPKQIAVRNNAGEVLLRAPRETLRAVNLILADLVESQSQVIFDVRLFDVARTRTRDIGPRLPQQFGVYNVASAARDIVNANQSILNQAIANGLIKLTGNPIQDLITEAVFLIGSGVAQSSLLTDTLGFFGNGLTLTGVTAAGGASFTLALNSSDTRSIDSVQLRAGNRQTSTFRAGTRYPIITGTYSNSGALSSSALAGVTVNGVSAATLLNQYAGSSAGFNVPQIQFEDLGTTLKATPVVQKSGEVSMHLDLKIEALSGATLDGNPILASRQIVSDITVKDGETAVLASTLSRSEAASLDGTPGLAQLPGLKDILSENNRVHSSEELVLLITPHVVLRRTPELLGPRIVLTETPREPE